MKGAKKPYHYISATAVGNRAFLLAVNANGRQVLMSIWPYGVLPGVANIVCQCMFCVHRASCY